jgi:hypothetical protein
LSQDKFWEQWTSNTGDSPEKPAEDKPAEAAKPAGSGETVGGVDADVLAAWLTSLPPDDPLTVSPTTPPPSQANAADLAELWPPAAPVDPFSGIQKSADSAGASDWDLAFDPVPAAPIPPSPAAAPVPPQAAAGAAPAVPPAAPATDFALDFDTLAGPVPGGNPFAAAEPPAATAQAPGAPATEARPSDPPPTRPVSPFGPPPPPVSPPAEALQAPPLKIQLTTGRRTIEQTINGEALIGRPDATRGVHPEIDLRLDDAVSRRHAKIFIRNGQYVITDLNSTNGTRHNQQWLQPEVEVPLKTGDEIEIGEITLIKIVEAPDLHA